MGPATSSATSKSGKSDKSVSSFSSGGSSRLSGITPHIRDGQKQRADIALRFKVIMLGTSMSGKSTFQKNLRIMNDVMTDETGSVKKVTQKWAINHRLNVKQYTWEVLTYIIKNISLSVGSASDMTRQSLLSVTNPFEKPDLFEKYSRDMLSLISHPKFNEAFELAKKDANTASMMVNAEHFIERASIILDPDFSVPSAADIMYSGVRSTGISESRFRVALERRPATMMLCDVGGQRTERRKWIHVWDSVNMVLFFIDVSDYVRKTKLREDNEADRWDEAMETMKLILNQEAFDKSLFRIILTKCDWVFDNYGASEIIEVDRLSVDVPEIEDDDQDDGKDDSDLSPEKRKQREAAKAARAKKAETAMSEPTLKMNTQEIMAYLRTQLPKYRNDVEKRRNVRVETVENASSKLDILYQLYLIHWPLEDDSAADPIPGLIEREMMRRDVMLERTLDEWGKDCEDWIKYDTSYLRKQIVHYVWNDLQYSADSIDTRYHSLRQPWDMLPQMAEDILRSTLTADPLLI